MDGRTPHSISPAQASATPGAAHTLVCAILSSRLSFSAFAGALGISSDALQSLLESPAVRREIEAYERLVDVRSSLTGVREPSIDSILFPGSSTPVPSPTRAESATAPRSAEPTPLPPSRTLEPMPVAERAVPTPTPRAIRAEESAAPRHRAPATPASHASLPVQATGVDRPIVRHHPSQNQRARRSGRCIPMLPFGAPHSVLAVCTPSPRVCKDAHCRRSKRAPPRAIVVCDATAS